MQVDELELESVRQMRELLAAARSLFSQKDGELEELKGKLQRGELGELGAEFAAGGAAGAAPGADGGDAEEGVGEDDRGKSLGIAIGRAPDGARPTGGLIEPPAGARRGGRPGGTAGTAGTGRSVRRRHKPPRPSRLPVLPSLSLILSPPPRLHSRAPPRRVSSLQGFPGSYGLSQNPPGSPGSTNAGEDAPMDRQEAFSQFKGAEGSDLNGELLTAKATFKQMKARRVELAGICNTSKQQIDTLRVALDDKKAAREASLEYGGGGAEIIDEEEYAYIQELKEAKASYKQAHTEMRAANAAMEGASVTADEKRAELLRQFDSWYTLSFSEEGAMDDAGLMTSQAGTDGGGGLNDTMDEEEKFEQLQVDNVMAEDPDSLAFVRARKAVLKKGGAKAGRLRG